MVVTSAKTALRIPLPSPTVLPSSVLTPTAYRALPTSPIVLDLGSSLLRAGFAHDPTPRLLYPPIVARARDSSKHSRRSHVGYEATSLSVRSSARSPFESGVASNVWALERLLDGTMVRLGMAEETEIRNEVVVTEPVAAPNNSRAMVMEILFEGYGVPGVATGVDALFDYATRGGRSSASAAMVIDMGNYATHVLPIVGNRMYMNGVRRVSVGGFHIADDLSHRLGMAYPVHAGVVAEAATALRDKVCYVAEDYAEELGRLWKDEDYFEQKRVTVEVPMSEERKADSAEEIERKAQARKEMGRRLYEMMKAKREAKAAQAEEEARANSEIEKAENDKDEEEEIVVEVPFTKEEADRIHPLLEKAYQFRRLKDLQSTSEDVFYLTLVFHGMKTVESMKDRARKRERALEQAAQQMGEGKVASIERAWKKRRDEDQLLATADEDLSPDQVKAKRKLRSLRAAHAFREQVRRQKAEEREAREAAETALRKRKEGDPKGYIREILAERKEIEGRMRQRSAANQAGSDRRSQAGRHRMKLLAQQLVPSGGGGKKDEDTFGMDDSDWDVYREIEDGTAQGELEDAERLEELEKEFLEMAPEHAAKNRKPPRGAATLFIDPEKESDIYIIVDRIRAPEIIWQPSLIGNDQVGLAEAFIIGLNALPEKHRRAAIGDIYVTGCGALLPGFRERLFSEIRMNLPSDWGQEITINYSSDPLSNPWKGAAIFAKQGGEEYQNAVVTRQEYEEKGADYLKEHSASNTYVPTPTVDRDQEKKRKKKKP